MKEERNLVKLNDRINLLNEKLESPRIANVDCAKISKKKGYF